MICIGAGVVVTLLMNVLGTILSMWYFLTRDRSQPPAKAGLWLTFNALQLFAISTLLAFGFSLL
jgi:hypothetical protein